MGVFSALFAEFKGVFGKAFLLAGLLPAALLYFGCSWFVSERSLTAVFEEFFKAAEGKSATILAIGTQLLLLALALFAARTFLLKYVQTLQPGLPRLRRALIRRQLVRRARVEHEIEHLELRYNAVRWLLERRHEVPVELPTGYVAPAPPYAFDRSSQALITCNELTPPGFARAVQPKRKDLETILAGAEALYACASQEHAALAVPLRHWRLMLRKPQAKALLLAVVDDVHRDLETAKSTRDGFPDPKWVGPTVLGTRSGALDDYALAHYGIVTSTMLTRLTTVLSAEDRSALVDARLTIEVLVNLAVALLLTSVFVAGNNVQLIGATWGVGLAFDLRTAAFLFLPVGLAWIFYWAAVFAFDAFAEKVTRSIDTNRLALLEKLGFEAPERVGEERAMWAELSGFFDSDKPLDGERKLRTK